MLKPIKLVISAFGPYKDRVEIDFTKLGENGIFLITGDTGSGKTSIFDALSFALFGEASGSRRENSSFRSDFASDDISTFVELEFVHKDVFYKLERIPRYTRKKKRGKGITLVGGEASLNFLDKVITGEKNVTDKCVEILGMNANQFKQIVMIAQGEFLDLLLAKTKDRATIFRHIFGTDIYKDISDCLKNKYLLKKREYEDMFTLIKGYIQGVQLSCVLNGNERTDQVLTLLDKELKSDIEVESNLEEKRMVLLDESSKLVEIISKGKIINDSILNLNKANERLNVLLRNKDKIKVKEETVKSNRDIWNVIMPKYRELINLKKDFVDKKNKIDNNKKDYLVLIDDFEQVMSKYNGIKDILNQIQNYNKLIDETEKKLSLLDEIDNLNKEFNNLSKKLLFCKLEDKREIFRKIKDCRIKKIEIDELRSKIATLKSEYVNNNEIYIAHYDLFLSAQAGILATDLKEGQACPVCGSLSHPCLASLVDNVLTKEELDNEKRELENKYQVLENVILNLHENEKKFEILRKDIINEDENSLIKEIDELESKCLGVKININDVNVKELDKKVQQLSLIIEEKKCILSDEDEKEKLNYELTKYKKLVVNLEKEIDEIRKKYDLLLNKKSNIESLINVLNDDIIDLERKIEVVNEDYVICYQELGYNTEEDYLTIRLEKDSILKVEEEINKYKEELLEVKGNINSLEKIVGDQVMVNLSIYEERSQVINNQLDNINLSLKNINSKISNNKKIYDRLKDVSEDLMKLEKEVMIYKDLSDTANGTIAGKNKLEFEQYVQASYFDRVLISANKRLSYMTDDRYQLLRKEESFKVSDKLGLELEVMDYYTGKKRDIKSLSGGESFKASLSLSLGMSDTIQEYSGGVVVDAMFIDEGFGSLDDESLEQAMNAIMMISENNKIIGIISHVNELKSRIDKKIVVKKSSSGSSVNLVI